MTDHQALLEAIATNPAEFTPASVLADYLDEHNDPSAPAARLAAQATQDAVRIGPKHWKVVVRADNKFPSLSRYVVTGQFGGYRWQKHGGDVHRCEAFADVIEVFGFLLAEEAKKAAGRKAKSAAKQALLETWTNPFKVGDVVYNSWGYDQTNVYFAQVVKVGPRSVTLRRISKRTVKETGWASANVAPDRDRFLEGENGEPFVVKFTFSIYDGKLSSHLPAIHGSWSTVGERESFYESWYA